MLENM